MSTYESALLRLLDERGYIHQLTDAAGLDALAAKQIVPGYIGFDATAPSLHIGSLVQIMMLRRLQQAVIDDHNVFAVLMDAVRVCSLGQITAALFEVGGQYRRSM